MRRRSLFRVFLLAFVTFAYFMPQWADWNIDSRLDLVHAMVDRHTLRIDAYNYNTWDKAVYKGHFYSDKAPGTAVLGAAVYAVFVAARSLPVTGGAIRALEHNSAWQVPIKLGRSNTQLAPAPSGTKLGGCQRTRVQGNVQYIPWGNRLVPPFADWALSKYVVTIGVDALLGALFTAFFFWFLGFFVRRNLYRWLLTGLYAFGTVALPYSANFYSHQLAAGFLFVAFALLFLYRKGMSGWWSVPVAGFLLGFAIFTEYTVAVLVLIVGLYGLWYLARTPRLTAGYLTGGLIPVVGLLAYNKACFGSPLDTGYSHDYCWSAAQAAGIAGFTYPHGGPLFDLTFGSFRGLFFMAPFLLLAAPGLVFMVKRRYRPEALVCAVSAVVFIVVLSAYWGWNGGRVDGPRYLVPVVPFIAFPVIFYLERLKTFRLGWAPLILTGVWSLFATWVLFLAGPTFPTSWLRNPLFQYSVPGLEGNHVTSNAGLLLGLSGWQSLVPLVVLWLLITGARPPRLEHVARWGAQRTVAEMPVGCAIRAGDDTRAT